MSAMVQLLSFASAGAASALFSAVWEGAVLALGVYLCLRLLPGLSAAARSVVWLNVFVLLVLLHFVPVFAPRADLSGGRVPVLHFDPRWSLALVAVWVALSLWRAVQLVLGMVHLRGLSRRSLPVVVGAELRALLADVLGGRAVRLCASEDVVRPSVLGFWRPRVLLPAGLIEHLTPQELEQVVLHEMEHLRRGDDWTNFLQKIGLVLFPLNPVLLWVERKLCAERELACDDRVMQSSAGRKAYALCLTRLAEFSLFRRSFSLVLGLWERRPELVRRVERIVSQPVRSMGRRPAMAATGSVLAGALGCAIALSHSPQLVSFTPEYRPLQSASLDPHEVARALGGEAQMMKAAMPVGLSQNHASGAKARAYSLAATARLKSCPFKAGNDSGPCDPDEGRQSLHRAVLKTNQRRAAGSQIASLRFPGTPDSAPAPAGPELDERMLVVLTEMTTFPAPPRVVLAVSPDGRTARPVAIPATYIVRTPNGWLIIQI